MALMKWLANAVKMCLLLTILRLESFVETGVRDLENELFFQDHSRNNSVVIFESERFCVMQGSILPVTIPPGHTPGDLQFFSYLAVYSPPPGTQKETIPYPRDSSSTKIDFRTIA